MEDYEVFVQHRLSELRKSTEEEWRPTASSSSSPSPIRFYGRAILPPLLSEKDKEEMQLYRKQVKKDGVRKMVKDDPRMAYVQTILHSVQLRTTPTLDELLQEQHSNRSAETNHDTSLQSSIETTGAALPPLTPTPSSAFKSHHERCLLDKVDSQPASRPSLSTGATHQSLSSDYVTLEDVENTKSASDCIEVQTQRPARVLSKRVFNLCSFFLHSSSSTIAKIPDIISHPPIDGDELERSGVETSFCHDFIAIKDICGSSFQEDSAMCDNLPVDKSEGTSLNDVEHEEEFQTSITLDSDEVGHLKQSEELFSLSENCNISDTDTTQTLSDHNQKTEPIHSQEDDSDPVPSAEPHRPSLQALLKKSQEYRRRQRVLRNQARNNKTQERNREPQRTSDEQSHSDKENDGFPHKDVTTAVEKEMNHVSAFISSDLCIIKPWENEKKKEGELILWSKNDHSENTHSQGHGDTKESVEEETNFRNQQNYSQEVKAHRIYRTIPTSDGAKTQEENVLSNVNFRRDQDKAFLHHTALSTENCLAESVVSNVSSDSSQHVDQCESNLTSLKVLISDLQSAVRENVANHSQSENSQSDLSFNDVQDSQQNEPVVKQSDDEEESQTLRRQSINNVPEGSELEPYFAGTKCVSLQTKEKEAEMFIKTSLGKSSTKEQEFSEETAKEEQTKPPAKGSLSVAQWKRIPEMFRTVSSETSSACDISVLSDTCNHSVEKREEFYAEGHDSIRSDSLNQSYDVDTPSGLWFQEESGSNFGSQGCLTRVQHLTPESDSELQTSVSKVKRRLDLHLSEDVQENKAEPSVVRRLSSTYRAALRSVEGHGDHRDKQEQLKQTHAAQRRALQEEHRKQQEELLQVLLVRYRHLHSVSLPRSKSSYSQPEDPLTFSTRAQTFNSVSQRYRPLLAAVMKGFLTRRLLRTERAAQLVRTIRDTQQFLQAFEKQQILSRHDATLLERVTLQLRAARYEIYDMFFSLSAREQMLLISRDRELNRERELRRLSGNDDRLKGKSSLSAATRKSLERKRGMLFQKKAAESHTRIIKKTGGKTVFSAELEARRPQIKRNPQRVSKTTPSPRPR